jgi:hypothetical protein
MAQLLFQLLSQLVASTVQARLDRAVGQLGDLADLLDREILDVS